MNKICPVAGCILLLLTVSPCASQNPKSNPFRDMLPPRTNYGDRPYTELAVHNAGNVWMTVTNMGQFGTGFIGRQSVDPLTGTTAPSCMFPANSYINYLYVGGFWIGAVAGRDTLVSIGVDDYFEVRELWPDPYPLGEITRKSIETSSEYFDESAKSEQDVIAIYTDTVTSSQYVSIDQTDGRPHMPLSIEITQRSYSWSYDYAEDFILFDYSVKNIGRQTLNKVYMAVFVDGDVHHESLFGPDGYQEDICGFKRTYPSGGLCDFVDTINIAFITDNDGDPGEESREFNSNSATGIAGIRVVRTPSDSLRYSFNWWATDYYSVANDFGPRQAGSPEDPFRDMNGYLGTPLGDRNKYYVMRHEEFDYDQLFTAKDHTADGWLARPHNAHDIADGYDARYLLSFGPFDISPGEILPVSFAWVCGENLHQNGRDFEMYYDPDQPEIYYNLLDFSDLAYNATWAAWIYDNPGVDTDEDGYKGKYRICCINSSMEIDNSVTPPETTFICLEADTSYYEGDGVPDFKGASPPPAPELTILPGLTKTNEGYLTVRWNGFRSEQTRDVFSNEYDFEGYRVYMSFNPDNNDFSLVASYDREDYNRWVWDNTRSVWILPHIPFTLDSLRRLYGEDFEPLAHDIDNPLYVYNPAGADSSYYFSQQDWNTSKLTDTLAIHKRFPNQTLPTILNLDSAALYYPEELTADGNFKYYEYEYVLRNLLPSRLYYVSVTAFDYGSPGHDLASLETKPTINMVAEYPQNSAASVEEKELNVVVYPNPYRIDAGYRETGYEGQGREDLPDDRVREIHFTNLPHKCTIRIFSIDGDLIRKIDHDFQPGDPQAMHDSWDLITRNTQEIVSGIYYFSVESGYGNQIGKIVIIM